MVRRRGHPCSLERLFHHRWAVPILAAFDRRGGLRFVQLYRGLDIRRESAAAALDALLDMGLLIRNPGYGHPLRPEYILTGAGAGLATQCRRFHAAVLGYGHARTVYRKWSMPVLRSVAAGGDRFNAIATALPGITPRALAAALKSLEEAALLERLVIGERPPVARYIATNAGRRLAGLLPDCA